MEPLHGNDVIHRDAQLDLVTRGHALDARLQLGRRLQEMASFAQQFHAGLGQLSTVAAAVEDQHVQILFQLLHRVGERRRHAMQFLGRRGKAALAVDGLQHGQGIQGQAHLIQSI